MAPDNKHKAWLGFVRKVADVPLEYSKDDLRAFRRLALRESPALLQLIESYLALAERSDVESSGGAARSKSRQRNGSQMHLFDLLREKRLFPHNLLLAQFASRVLPHMRTYRFDKMSRSDIAARIIEYIERSDPRSRAKLEKSMRDALKAMKQRPIRPIERQSFLSKWEKSSKGLNCRYGEAPDSFRRKRFLGCYRTIKRTRNCAPQSAGRYDCDRTKNSWIYLQLDLVALPPTGAI